MKQNQFEFKPFDKVLVRDHHHHAWRADIYSHSEKIKDLNDSSITIHICIGNLYKYCIPYNEETAHLIGTDKPYKEPEEKEWHVYDGQSGFEAKFTSEELIKFVTQQVNNKDLRKFTIVHKFDPNEVHNYSQPY